MKKKVYDKSLKSFNVKKMQCYVSKYFAGILTDEFKYFRNQASGLTHKINQNGRLEITIDTNIHTYRPISGDAIKIFWIGNDGFWIHKQISNKQYEISHIIQHGIHTKPGECTTDIKLIDIFPNITDDKLIDVYLV